MRLSEDEYSEAIARYAAQMKADREKAKAEAKRLAEEKAKADAFNAGVKWAREEGTPKLIHAIRDRSRSPIRHPGGVLGLKPVLKNTALGKVTSRTFTVAPWTSTGR